MRVLRTAVRWMRGAIVWLRSWVDGPDEVGQAIDRQRSQAMRTDPRSMQDMHSRGGGLA